MPEGVSDKVATTCLARMQNWWKLAQAVFSAEFPDFGIARCFSVFDIARVVGGMPANFMHVPCDELIRLADLLALGPIGLVAKFQ